MKKCFSISLCLLVSCSISLYAQSEATLRGTVRARADGSVLSNAAARLEGATSLQAFTGPDGVFSFQRLVPGPYTVVISHAGFAETRQQIVLKPREVATLVLDLSLSGLTQSIEVRSPMESAAGTYSPGSTILQRETVEALPADRKNNLTDMIAATAPGMVRSHDDFVHVRGNEISLNAFINGTSFWENPHSVLSAGLPAEIIQSANVMTGSFPAEYGNRFGGVVDIVTRSGMSRNSEGSLTLGVGTALRHNAAVEYGGHTQRVGYYAYSSGFESARFLSPNDPRSIHDTGRGTHNFLQLDFDVNSRDLLKLVMMADGTNFQIPKTEIDDQFRPNLNAVQQSRAQSAILTWSHAPSANALVTTSLYQRWSRVSLDQSNEPLASVAQNNRTLNTVGIKSDLTRIAGRHTIKGGIDLVNLRPKESLVFDGEGYVAFSHILDLPHTHLRGPNRGPITFDGRESGGQASVYLQDATQWTRKLRTHVGLRFDRYSLETSASHFSPRVSLSYRLSERGTVLHASYDHFFVPPAVENVLISSAGLTRHLQDFAEPLPPLQPIVENQVEMGISHPFSRSLRVGVTGYYRHSTKPVHTILFPDSRIYAYANFDKGKAYGLEMKTEVPIIERLGLSGYLNYALSRVYFWNPVNAGFLSETHHLENADRFLAPMDQTHTSNAGLTYRNLKKGFWASMTFEYGSGTPVEADHHGAAAPGAPIRIPGHFTQDLTLGVDLLRREDRPRLSLQFNVENLTNNVYRVSQESTFSPGEYYNPRFFSSSLKIRF
jgi:hypothetical protein